MPTIVFNSGTGSDTAASGCGPATAISGTSASYSGSVFTLSGSPNLSTVTTSHILWVQTTTGRQYFEISAVNDAADTVTVTNAPAGTATGLTWAIGGKRSSFNTTTSRALFADAKPGWVIETETDQTGITSTIICSALGNVLGSTTGSIVLRGNSTTTKRILSTATNNTSLLSGGLSGWTVENLQFTSTAGTKTTSYGIVLESSSDNIILVKNCEFGHATNTLRSGILRTSTAQPNLFVIGCDIHHCLGYGLDSGGGAASSFKIFNSNIRNNVGDGIYIPFQYPSTSTIVRHCRVYSNGGVGINFPANGSSNSSPAIVCDNIIHGNSSHGISIEHINQITQSVIFNNSITANGTAGTVYGISYSGSGSADALKGFIDYNNYGASTLANRSGATSPGLTIGANSIQVDPGYANVSTGDFTPSNAAMQVGYL